MKNENSPIMAMLINKLIEQCAGIEDASVVFHGSTNEISCVYNDKMFKYQPIEILKPTCIIGEKYNPENCTNEISSLKEASLKLNQIRLYGIGKYAEKYKIRTMGI